MFQGLVFFSVDLQRYVHYVHYNSSGIVFTCVYTGCIKHVQEIHVIK